MILDGSWPDARTAARSPVDARFSPAAVAVSTSTLQNRFQHILGRGIATQIRQIRLDRAKREIAQSKRPLAEIARDVGFGNRLCMYDVFRRELGMTPSAYRKQQRGRQDKGM